MKHAYPWARPLLVALFSFIAFGASAQQAWRPFRPGLIYSFNTPTTGTNPPATFLLRLDSAYTTMAGDSAWAFNRLLRPNDGSVLAAYYSPTARKSRNNLFGARLTWTLGTSEFVLENVAEGSLQAAQQLRLRPRAAIGSTWTASAAPALTATLTSRVWEPVGAAVGSPSDSVATITLSSGAVLRLSRQYGLLAGPRWLAASTASAPVYTASQLPTALSNSALNPTTLFNLQPGDLLGYDETSRPLAGPPCTSFYTLRGIQSRQTVGDSLIYTYQQQTRTVNYSGLGCYSAPGTTVGPVLSGRMAFSLRTGQSRQYSVLPLLSGEYRLLNPAMPSGSVLVGTGIRGAVAGSTGCFGGRATLVYQQMYPQNIGGSIQYSNITDGNWYQTYALQEGLGPITTGDAALVYYRRSTPGGVITCGSPTSFVNLLPTRAAQAAAIATLYPSPVAEAATLTLAAPARPGTALCLTDALGRAVLSGPVPAGQSAVAVPLAGQPAGLYLLHLTNSDGTNATWRLTHE
ncbi:hypothetical protein KB206_03385 [Microvirga sp. STS02]|uniref:hypothetical protein n=1 Tax=Hymenobacter negativus TaxID=2795026 RepID=UPI0018DBE21C|nr:MULTISPECIES: hypothetical protein [Bacteria]MBH8567909.1 hypothetical protein [Hymenobacter negativus]MBR7207645.1 hypothetical protein [Microvirga sp. STS02]